MSNSVSDQSNISDFYSAVIAVPFARIALGIRNNEHALIGIDFLPPTLQEQAPVSMLTKEVVGQLLAYFADPRFQFDLPLEMAGTTFQQQVWQALRHITPGRPQCYAELAQQLQSSARAIGGACRRNPIPVVVPCHRVVARQGPGGFAGATRGDNIMIKRSLLDHEAGA